MSVVALSPKVGAPSSSFSTHDKTLNSNLSQTQANSTYQGASAHTAGSAKFEASGAYEPHFTGTSTAPVQAAPIASLATHVSQSLHSSPNVSFNASSSAASSLPSSTQTFSVTPAAISSAPLFNGTNTATPISSNVAGIDAAKAPLAIADATPVLPAFNGASQALKASPFAESRPQVTLPQTNAPRVNGLKDRASLHADASFSLLTGPRSISGVRGGQIAAPVSTSAFSSITSTIGTSLGVNALSTTSPSLSLSVSSSIPADIFMPPSSSIGTSGTELPAFNPSSTGSVSPITPDLAVVFGPQTVFTGAAVVDPSTSEGNSSVNNSSGNSGNSGNISSSNSSAAIAGTVEQSNSAQAADQSARNEVAQPTVLEQFTQVFGDAKAQVSQVEDPAIASNPDDRQQALADVFAKNDNQLEKQAQEEASQKQQAAAEQAKQQQSQAQSQAQQAQEQVKQAQEKAQAQQQQQVDSLKARDSEVKAHEHAHATVGGQYAQSPSFKYEKGADGQRYATDGEVQIDVSAVGGDPLATINKMKQVYAAAMAPVDPSSADIRVAAEALQKMNEAKEMLIEERQQQIVDLQTTQTLLGADAQIKGLPPLQERIPVVTGKVEESGNIAKEEETVSTSVSDALDRIKQGIEAQTAKTVTDTHSKTPPDIVNSSSAANTKTTVESIEPPTATLASAMALAPADLAARFISRANSTASRYYAAVAQANP
ncbi:putative metalloprotease CJM1_0395 family protein [Shewanella sp. MF08487]|uniref:putative metalloprotease CJM1_0395 family protein n=1 Tax=Shewanella sp. MF08487 TaxID=3434873 RepID=UPI003D796A8D